MRTIENELELDGNNQILDVPNHLFLEIENTSGSNLIIKINDGTERAYENGSLYQTPISSKLTLYKDSFVVRGASGQTIKYSYILPD